MNTLELEIVPENNMSTEEFFEFCVAHRDLRLERTQEGEIKIMSPTGSETGNKNIAISSLIWLWNQETKLGKSFDSSTGFTLSNGAVFSPDTSWIAKERWEALSIFLAFLVKKTWIS